VKNAGQVFALHHDNTVLWMRFAAQNLFFNPSPALADLDGDGRLETIIPSSNRRLYVFGPTGADMPGWPQFYSTTTYTESSPLVADLDGDGGLDILLGHEGRFVNAWSASGTPLDGFPLALKDAMRGTPAVVDLDQNGDVEIIAAGYDRTVYVWDLSAPYDKRDAPWPMFHANAHRNAVYAFTVPTAVGGGERPPAPAVSRLEQNYPNPFNPQTTIAFSLKQRARVVIAIYDVTGARVRTLLDETRAAGSYTDVRWDGTNATGLQVASGVYFYQLITDRFSQTRKMVLLK
jgi:WD40 repeat protein